MIPRPDHDVWLRILELISNASDSSTVKACNLVCAGWHRRLQPILLSSAEINWETAPLTIADMHIMRSLAHFIKSLALRGWHRPGSLTLYPLLHGFKQVKDLRLYGILFSTFVDLRDSLISMTTTLESLVLRGCELGDEVFEIMDAMDGNKSGRYTSGSHPARPHKIALSSLELAAEQHDIFMSLMLQWLTMSPTISTLRSLRVVVSSVDDCLLQYISDVVQNPACHLKDLDIIFINESSMFISSNCKCSSSLGHTKNYGTDLTG
jgi:hypothetical protein